MTNRFVSVGNRFAKPRYRRVQDSNWGGGCFLPPFSFFLPAFKMVSGGLFLSIQKNIFICTLLWVTFMELSWAFIRHFHIIIIVSTIGTFIERHMPTEGAEMKMGQPIQYFVP